MILLLSFHTSFLFILLRRVNIADKLGVVRIVVNLFRQLGHRSRERPEMD